MGGVQGLVDRIRSARFKFCWAVWTPALMPATEMTTSLSSSHRSRDVRSADHRTLEQAGLRRLPVFEPRPPLHLVAQEGQLQVHTAPYRGSFGTVMSQALRAAGLGSRVLVAQFLKGGVVQGPDAAVTLCDRLSWMRPAVLECLSQPAANAEPVVIDAVQSVWNACAKQLISGDLDQLVLDELGLAIAFGYLDEREVLCRLEQRPASMDVIITGPSIPDSLMALADQVTELRRGL